MPKTVKTICLIIAIAGVLLVSAFSANAEDGLIAFEKKEYTVTLGNGGIQVTPVSQNISSWLQYEWSSADKSIAKVSAYGYVTPVAGGKTTIRCVGTDTEKNTYMASYELTVIVPVRRITTDKSSIVLTTEPDYTPLEEDEIYYSFTPDVTIEPENATIKTLVWTSSNTDVARVDENGKITAGWIPGNAVITGKPADGSWASVQINVTVPKIFFTTKELRFTDNEPQIVGFNIIRESGLTSIQIGETGDCFNASSITREAGSDKKSTSHFSMDGMQWYSVTPKKAGQGAIVIVINGRRFSIPIIVEHSAVIDEIGYPAKQVTALTANKEANLHSKTHFNCEVLSIEDIQNAQNQNTKLVFASVMENNRIQYVYFEMDETGKYLKEGDKVKLFGEVTDYVDYVSETGLAYVCPYLTGGHFNDY